MKKILIAFLLASLARGAWAVAAPTGLTVTAIQSDQSAVLTWTDDPLPQQYYIYLDGTLVYQPFRADTTQNGSQRFFKLQSLPMRSPVFVNMRALNPPQTISGLSVGVSAYAQAATPIPVYVTSPAQVICVSGCSGGQGGPVTVTNPASAAVQVAGSITNTVNVNCLSGCGGGGGGGATTVTNTVNVNLPYKVNVGATFVTNTAGTPINVSGTPIRSFAMVVKGTGAAATYWDVGLEGSIDGVNYSTMLEHWSDLYPDGEVLFGGVISTPALYVRVKVYALTLGPATNIQVNLLGVQ